MENKKTYVNLSWLVYIFMGVVGFFLVRFFFDELNLATVYDLDLDIYVYDLLIIVYGFIVCGFVYNLGKFIFSKACGYKLVYFNLYFMGIEKVDNKNKFFFGLKHELSCKVVMEHEKEDANTTLPLLGGTIASLVAILITYLLIFLLKTSATTKFFFLVSSLFYYFIILLNIVPCRMDSLNDGFTLVLLKDKVYKKVYLNNLKNLGAITDTTREFIYQDIEVENHPLNLEAQLYNFYYLLEKEEFEKAYTLASKMNEYRKNIILEEHQNSVLISHVFNMCLNHKDEELKKYYLSLDSMNRSIINNGKKFESIKTALYIFTFIDEDKEGYAKVINDISKNKEKYKNKRFLEKEEKLIKMMINYVQENKPEWNE